MRGGDYFEALRRREGSASARGSAASAHGPTARSTSATLQPPLEAGGEVAVEASLPASLVGPVWQSVHAYVMVGGVALASRFHPA